MAQEQLQYVDVEGDFMGSEEEEGQDLDIMREISEGLKFNIWKPGLRILKKMEEDLSKTKKDFDDRATIRKDIATDVIKHIGKGRLIFVAEDQDGE